MSSLSDREKLAAWLQTHWATARMAAKHCPGLADRRVKYVALLLEELAAEGKIPVMEIPRTNRIGQYTQFFGTEEERDWGPKD